MSLPIGTEAVIVAENNPETNSPALGSVGTVTGNLGGYVGVSGNQHDYRFEVDGKVWVADDNELQPVLPVGTRIIVIADNDMEEDDAPEFGTLGTILSGPHNWDEGRYGVRYDHDGDNWVSARNEMLPLIVGERFMIKDYPDDERNGLVGTLIEGTWTGSDYYRLKLEDAPGHPESLLVLEKELTFPPAEIVEGPEGTPNDLVSAMAKLTAVMDALFPDVEDPAEEEFDILLDRFQRAAVAAEGHPHLPELLKSFVLGFALDSSDEANAALKIIVGSE